MFPDRWSKYIIDSKWKGVTAGGPPPMTIDSDE